MDYIHDNFLVAILYYSYLKCYHWGKMGEDLSVLFFKSVLLSYNSHPIKFTLLKIFLFIYLFIYSFWLRQVLVAARGIFLVVACGLLVATCMQDLVP